jgi:hypothetical protein
MCGKTKKKIWGTKENVTEKLFRENGLNVTAVSL